MTTFITTRSAVVAYHDHWAVVMHEQDARLINPTGDLAATFTDPAFAQVVADMLNAPAGAPADAPAPTSERESIAADNAASIAVDNAASAHELLEAANEVVERQNAEIAALRQRHVRMLRYLHLLVAVALDSQRANTTSANHGSSVEQASVPVSANCDAPASSDAPPINGAGIDLSTDVSIDVTDGADGTHEAEVPA